jgi:hypothetical protein
LFVSVYLILGHTYEHIGLIVAMEELKLFDNGKIFNASSKKWRRNQIKMVNLVSPSFFSTIKGINFQTNKLT